MSTESESRKLACYCTSRMKANNRHHHSCDEKTAAIQALITRREQEAEARTWVDSDSGRVLPVTGEIVLARLEWPSGKEVYAVLKSVDESDCFWRTADDNSEIDYSVNVTHWRSFTNPTPADSLNLSKSKGLKPAGDGDAEKPKTEHYLSQNGNSPIECICGKSFTAFDDAKMHIDQVVIGIYADGLTGLFGADTPTKTENEK